jgi:hypothetical protein
VLVAAFALVGSASPAAANTRDIETFDIPFLPCTASAPDIHVLPSPGTGNDGAFAHVCFVRMMGSGIAWQASTGEWILFNLRLGFSTQAQCEQFAGTSTITVQLMGAPVSFDTLACQQPFAFGPWVLTFRFLSHPLPPGTYTATFTMSQAGGPTNTLTQNVAVIPLG